MKDDGIISWYGNIRSDTLMSVAGKLCLGVRYIRGKRE